MGTNFHICKHILFSISLLVTFQLAVGSLEFINFDDVGDLTLLSNSYAGDGHLILTAADASRVGAAWYDARQYVLPGFDTTFEFEIFGNGSSLMDGLSFVVQQEGISAIGSVGPGALGYGDTAPTDTRGIVHSIAVEFDVHKDNPMNDPDGNHISVHTRPYQANSAHEEHSIGLVNSTRLPDMASGNHTVRIVYQVNSTFDVYMDDLTTPKLSLGSINLQNYMPLPGGRAYVGFAASTPPASTTTTPASHLVRNWAFWEGNATLDVEATRIRSGDGFTFEAGLGHEFTVQLVDIYGNNVTISRGDIVTVTISGDAVIPTTVTDNEDGTYTVAFTPTKSGAYTMFVRISGEKTRTDPYQVEIAPGPLVAANCVASGSGFTDAQAYVPNSFQVQAMDKNDNPLTTGGAIFQADFTGFSTQIINSTDNGDGSYTISYTIQTVGSSALTVNCIQGNTGPTSTISNSPSVVKTVAGPLAPSKCTVSPALPDTVIVGEVTKFNVTAYDAHNNRILTGGESFSAFYSGVTSNHSSVQYTDHHNGMYEFFVDQDNLVGTGKVKVEYGATVLPDFPHTFTLDPGPVRPLKSILGLSAVSGPPSGFGYGIFFLELQLQDDYGNPVDATGLSFDVTGQGFIATNVTHVASFKIQSDGSIQAGGVYASTVTPTSSGTHTLHISYQGTELDASPLTFSAEAHTDDHSLAPGEVAGIVVGSLAGVSILIAGIWFWRRRARRGTGTSGPLTQDTSSRSDYASLGA